MNKPIKNSTSISSKKSEFENERLRYTIQRLDHYFDSVNNKANVYLALNTFLTGGVATIMSQTQFPLKDHLVFTISGIFILTLGLFSLMFLAYTSLPFLSEKIDSLYYFGSISKCSSQEFHRLSKSAQGKKDLKDLREQVYQLSCGLKAKFAKLKTVGILLIIQFILLIPYFTSLIF